MAACDTRKASVCHAVVAVFLQFFSWGLITAPMIHILNTTFKVKYRLYFVNTKYQHDWSIVLSIFPVPSYIYRLLFADLLPSLALVKCHSCSAVFILNSDPTISFQDQALLMNGVVMGVKGFLSFLSAPLIGALSDVFGRKMFLLITALFTCLPVPFLKVL